MKANIIQLFQTTTPDTTGIATVTTVKDGHAVEIDFEGVCCPVAGHLSQVEALKVGDQVLILKVTMGLVIAGRLRSPTEIPAPRLEAQKGRLIFEAAQSVCLQAGQSMIEVHADGRIQIDGRQITGQATGNIGLHSPIIKLN
ncbi:MAG: hypothetical protein WBB23_24280 [Desulforhopalus sp.]